MSFVPRSIVLASLLATGGCLGEYSLLDGGADDQGVVRDGGSGSALRNQFNAQVKPITDGVCASCHNKDGGAGAAFLKPDAYDSLRAWPGMIVRDPATSRLITKGAHAGPAFTSAQLGAILPWLTAEAKALPPDTLATAPTTPPARVTTGPNTIDLGTLDAKFAGAKVTFTAAYAGSSLVLSDLTIRASMTSGLRAVHPLFLIWSGGKKYPDPTDSLATVDITVARNDSATLGPGTVVLLGVGALDELAIAFLKLDTAGAVITDGGMPMDGGDGGVMGGCKNVPSFTTNTRPPLMQRCVSCHGGTNTQATNGLDMTKVNDTSMAAQAAACAQIKNRINTTNPAASAIFSVVAPNSTGHPYRFPDGTTFNAYQMMVTTWINAEK